MNSRRGGSETELARAACLGLGVHPSLLIGGLGMGFTLRAALATLPAQASVVVAELVPAVVDWARGPLAGVFAGCLDDPRLTLTIGNVGALIRADAERFDAILLDVDNGPDPLVAAGNAALYDAAGLAAACRALRPGGVLAVWSERPDAAFAQVMRRAGFLVDELRAGSGGGRRGARHIIWLGRRAHVGGASDDQQRVEPMATRDVG